MTLSVPSGRSGLAPTPPGACGVGGEAGDGGAVVERRPSSGLAP
ncbi:hypothetical protein [Actinomadura sp. CNU-125]|nr:hypothetical protein [Actinomadura sp. CNU-125]